MAKADRSISFKIELTGLKEEHFFTSEKTGKIYADFIWFMTDEPDDNGLNGGIKQQVNSVTREKEKGKPFAEQTQMPWVGNGVILKKGSGVIDDEALPVGAVKPVPGVTAPVTDAEAKKVSKKLPF